MIKGFLSSFKAYTNIHIFLVFLCICLQPYYHAVSTYVVTIKDQPKKNKTKMQLSVHHILVASVLLLEKSSCESCSFCTADYVFIYYIFGALPVARQQQQKYHPQLGEVEPSLG